MPVASYKKFQDEVATEQGPALPLQRHDNGEELGLREPLDSARLEVTHLKAEVVVLHEKIRALSQLLFVQPPVEVLTMIFSWALPPSSLLDPSLVGGPQSPWSKALRLKKSIVRVCKTWHSVGLGFLYEEVMFRRIGQIPAFLRTLETSGISDRRDSLVKKITISAHIPQKYSLSCQKHLQSIFSFCRQIHQFTLASPNVLPDIITLPITHSHITTLEVTDTFNCDSLFPVLARVCDTLRSLSFYPTMSDKLHTAVCFPQLKTFVCKFLQSDDEAALSTAISGAWSMPALENFSSHSLSTNTIHTFCLAHGRRLRFLQVIMGASQRPPNSMQEILDACPSLEHLVVVWNQFQPISHRNIKWIDFRPSKPSYQYDNHDFPWIHWAEVMQEASKLKTALPALQGIRILLDGLPSSIPLVIPPTRRPTGKDTFSIQHPGIDIRFKRGFLYNSTATGRDAACAPSWGKEYHYLDDDCESTDSISDIGSADSDDECSDLDASRLDMDSDSSSDSDREF